MHSVARGFGFGLVFVLSFLFADSPGTVGSAFAAACGGKFQSACGKFSNARSLGKAPKLALTSKACRKRYKNRNAYLNAGRRQCWACPSGFRRRVGKLRTKNACRKIKYAACHRGLKKRKMGGRTICFPVPRAPKSIGLSLKEMGKLALRARKDLAKNKKVVKAMSADIKSRKKRTRSRGTRSTSRTTNSPRSIHPFCLTKPSLLLRLTATATGFKTFTYEVVGDVQIGIGRNWSAGVASYYALDGATKDHMAAKGYPKRYPTSTVGKSLGLAAGADGSYQIGVWRTDPAGLGGEAHFVTLAASYYWGISVSAVYTNCAGRENKCRFVGIVASPQAGFSAEAEVGKANTVIYLQDFCTP